MTTPRPTRKPMKISDMALLNTAARAPLAGQYIAPTETFALPKPHPGVVPDGGLAMDSMGSLAVNSAAYNWAVAGAFHEGLGFLGYPYLSELTQRAEYRRPSEIIAKEMTRRWITLSSTGNDPERVKLLEAALKKFGVQSVFREAAEQDGFFGVSHIYIDTGQDADAEEMSKPLILSPMKIPKGGLKGLKTIEPMWVYPGAFNADRPLAADFYKPATWYVMGTAVHVTRMLTLVGREVPDLLKPAYQFGGLSLSQMAKPYVDNWLRTRQSVSDIIHAFSVMVLKTNLASILSGGGGDDLLNRLAVFNQLRDNRGTFAIDKDTEEFENVSAPLASLDKLQAQSQEQMAAVDGIPLVILFGITPSGLNASSDGEIKTFYAWIMAQQEHLFRKPLQYIIDLIQLSEFGDIDPDITFGFNSLWETSDAEKAVERKADADTDAVYIDKGVISPDEARDRLAKQEGGVYHGLAGEAPEPPADPADEEDPEIEDADPDAGTEP